VTVIISVIQGLNHYVSGQISGLGADTIYIDRFPWIIRSYEEYLKYQKRKDLTEEHYLQVLKQATLAAAVAPEVQSQRTLKYRNESLDGVSISGTSDAYMQTANVMPETGRFFTSSEVDFNRNICVIGYEVADKLFRNENPIEKTIKIGPTPFLVIGVLEKRGQMFGFSLDNTAIVPYTSFLKAFGSRRSITIQCKAKDPALTEDMIDQLIGIMRRERGLGADRPDDFSINQQSQLMDFYKNMTQVLWIVLIGIGSISLLIGGIGIMNIMLVSVTERTREIGIRKALGAKNRVILWQFLVESMFISSIGVTLGIIFSVIIASVIRSVSPIPVNISLWVLFLGVGFTVAIGLFFGLYPASKAARLDPIVALRYE
jgi:putative ABC transport system permease protein